MERTRGFQKRNAVNLGCKRWLICCDGNSNNKIFDRESKQPSLLLVIVLLVTSLS